MLQSYVADLVVTAVAYMHAALTGLPLVKEVNMKLPNPERTLFTIRPYHNKLH